MMSQHDSQDWSTEAYWSPDMARVWGSRAGWEAWRFGNTDLKGTLSGADSCLRAWEAN